MTCRAWTFWTLNGPLGLGSTEIAVPRTPQAGSMGIYPRLLTVTLRDTQRWMSTVTRGIFPWLSPVYIRWELSWGLGEASCSLPRALWNAQSPYSLWVLEAKREVCPCDEALSTAQCLEKTWAAASWTLINNSQPSVSLGQLRLLCPHQNTWVRCPPLSFNFCPLLTQTFGETWIKFLAHGLLRKKQALSAYLLLKEIGTNIFPKHKG